jgi:hypothetical protein
MDNTSEKQIKRVVLNRMERCSVCHHEFVPDDIRVVSRTQDMWMMVVTCTECHARNFVAAVLGDGDPDQAQLALRQLSRDDSDADIEIMSEADEAPDGAPVSIDDVIEMHEFLADFDGDFRRYFRSA